MPMRDEAMGGGKADAARGAGYDGGTTGRDGRMVRHINSSALVSTSLSPCRDRREAPGTPSRDTLGRDLELVPAGADIGLVDAATSRT